MWVFGPQSDFATPVRPYQLCSSDVCMWKWSTSSGCAAATMRFSASSTTGKTRDDPYDEPAPRIRPKQVVAMPSGDKDTEWIEFVPLYGLVSHVGGLHLAQLRMMKRMADKMEDTEFSQQCDQWLAAGSDAMETDLWGDTHYLLYHELVSARNPTC